MSTKSNDQGRAFEYVFINRLCEYISRHRPVRINENSSYAAAEAAFNATDQIIREILSLSANAAVSRLNDLEPLLLEDTDELDLIIQKDTKGEEGDVRDILIIRSSINWEIGLSIKHNHFAVKHSRLSPTIDFGDKWYGKKCSSEYWSEIYTVFDKLDPYISSGKKWRDIPKKADEIYVPLLKAFAAELKRAYDDDNTICRRFVDYLLGNSDFYKIISIDRSRITRIQGYNLHGQLNKSGHKKPKIIVPLVRLPDEIYHIGFKKGSKTTVVVAMNNGWTFSFRIHNADEKVIKSLKFDIQFVGVPVVLSLDYAWNE